MEGKDLSPGVIHGQERRRILTHSRSRRSALWRQLEENDDATLERHCELWKSTRRAWRCRSSTMTRAIRNKLGWSYKKRHWVPPSETKRLRGAFRERLSGVDPKRLVFVDESSTNIALTGAIRQGTQALEGIRQSPKNWGKNVTLISSITVEGMGPSMSIEGSSDTESFGLYMRDVLAPQLSSAHRSFVMDNLSVHRSNMGQRAHRRAGM